MIRTVLVVAWLILFFLVTLPLVHIIILIQRLKPGSLRWLSLRMVKFAALLIALISGVRVDLEGLENLQKNKPCLLVGNHRSMYDIIITILATAGPTSIIAKKELKKVPVLNLWMMAIECYFLDRDNLKQGMEVILGAIEKIKSGMNVLVYPEGTRNKTSDVILPFKAGCFKIAEKTKCDIIPITIVGSDQIFEAHFPKVKRGVIKMVIGAPIPTVDMNREDFKTLPERVEDIIRKTYEKYTI